MTAAKTTSAPVEWRNRIVAHGEVRAVDLVAHPRNWRKHPKEQAARLQRSLGGVGWVQDVIVNQRTGRMLDGHLRAEMARAQGENTPVPVVYVDLSDDEERLVLASLDPIAGMAVTDEATLAALVRSIDDGDLRSVADDIAAALGVATGEAEAAVEDAGAEVDRVEELREKWQTAEGQIWELGAHRLMCASCLKLKNVQKLIGATAPMMVFADPPYGVSIVAANVTVGGGETANGMIPFGGVKNRRRGFVGGGEGDSLRHGHYAIEETKAKRLGAIGGAKPFGSKNVRGSIGAANVVDVGKYAPIIGDETTDTAVQSSSMLLREWPKAVQVWWGGNYYADKLPPSSCWLVWNKETTGNFADCELAWTNQDRAAKLFTHRWNGMLRDSERERRIHPTQKPVALAAWVFGEMGKDGDAILDPFCGCGPTIMAAEAMNRRVFGMELCPDYIAVILERWSASTGKTPVLLNE